MDINFELLELMDKYGLNFKKYEEIITTLCMLTNQDEDEIVYEVNKLIKEGYIVNSSKKKFANIFAMDLYRCKVVTNPKGFGFGIELDDRLEEDIFIPKTKLKDVLNEDIALIRIKNKDRMEGEVYNLIKRARRTIVGRIQVLRNFAFVIPDDKKYFKDIYVPKGKIGLAQNGDKVVTQIIGFEKERQIGEVIEILGKTNKDDPKLDVLSIIRSYELIEEFPEEVLQEARMLPQTLKEKQLIGREDFREKITFTVDGEDAKDLDDAVGIEYDEKKETFTLYVHIADVGEYVKKGGKIDEEAFARGTSVYFPNMVLPMLPKELSNHICSLNPNEERLTLSCVMEINKQGQVLNHRIVEGIIKTTYRMNYNDTTKILENDKELCKKFENIVRPLKLMEELTLILEKTRDERGALELDIKEPKIIVNEETMKIEKFESRPRTISDRIIESFMIIANETVAKHYHEKKLPFVYRIHEKINEEKIKSFIEFCQAMGINANISKDLTNIKPKEIQTFLNSIKENPANEVINKVLLRSMQKAKYDPQNLGHFGLASINYCHFTAPIRRYPDLTIHRIIKEDIHNKLNNEKQVRRLKRFVGESSKQSSEREVFAEKAERDVDDYFKARYMSEHIGEVYDGIVNGVTANGLFVQLENTCEGFVRLTDLPDDTYEFVESKYRLNGKQNKFHLGMKLTIKVAGVSISDRKVDFNFIKIAE